MKKILLLSMCLATAFLFLSVSAHAATNTFTGNGDWYNTNNWAGGARPTSTDDASILPGLGNGAGAIAYVDHGSVTVNSMTINPTNGSAASAGYIVGNGTLNVTGALTVGGTGTTTTFLQYNGNGALNAGSIDFSGNGGASQQQNLTFGGAGGGSLTVGGGTGTITHTGTSTLNILGRSATPVTINANINAPDRTYLNAGDQPTGAITLNSGNSWNVFVTQVSFNANNSTNTGTLNINGGSLTTQAVYLNNGNQGGNSVVNLNAGGTIKAFDIRRVQAGASQTFNWNDGTIVNWQANAAQILQSNLGSGTPLVLSLAGTGTHTFEVNGAAGTNTVSSSAMLVDKAGENGTLNKTGLGTLILNGANTHSGATTLRAGTLALGHTNALQNSTLDTGSSGAQAVSFTAAGTNTYNLGGLGGGDDLALGANGLSVGVNNTSTSFAGGISGTGGLTKAGSGTLTLSGSNSYTGATTVSAGTLVFGNTSAKAAGNVEATAAATVGLGVGAGSGDYSDANVAALFNTTLAGFSLDPASSVAVDTTAGNFTQQTALTAARALTKLGANTLTLTGANTYSGTTTVSLGTLVVSNSTLTATISSNSVAVAFASAPSTGMTYTVLPGALATNSLGTTPVVIGLGSGQSATVTNDPNLVVQVTSSDPTFEDTYPGNDPEAIDSVNGLAYLMNYALGGTGPGSNPALPVLTSDANSLTLTANIRNSGQGVSVVGEYTYNLAGDWTEMGLTATGANPSVENTTVKSFSISVEPGQPRKFMRFKVTKSP